MLRSLSAQLNAVELRRNLHATIMGKPTGEKLNHMATFE